MSLHPTINFTAPTGDLSTIWGAKVETLEAAEPIVKRAVSKIRRQGGKNTLVEVYDDLADRVVWRGRVK